MKYFIACAFLTTLCGLSLSIAKAEGLEACTNIKSPLRGSIFFTNAVENIETCQRSAEIISVLDRVLREVNGLQEVKGLGFFFARNSSEISYLDRKYFFGSLNLSYDSNGAVPLLREQQEIIWTHEIGHAILDKQLASDWDWYSQRSSIMEKWGEAVVQATDLEFLLDKEMDPKQRRQIQEKIESLGVVIAQKIEEYNSLPNLGQIETIMAPYLEAFADVVALVDTNNPRAMSFALANPLDPNGENSTPEEREIYEERDYSSIRDVATWDRAEAHAMLAPAISVWWNQHQNEIKPNRKKALLRGFYLIILGELRARAQDPALWSLTPQQANHRLIDAIVK